MVSPHLPKKSKFWKLCQLVPGSESLGYRTIPQAIATNFFQQIFQPQFPQISDPQSHAMALLKIFRGQSLGTTGTQIERAHAGLCLRCWVSHPSLTACMKLATLFGSTGQFSYRELLPFVLTDDGRQLVVPTSDGNGYQIIGDRQAVYPSFSLEVLRTYQLKESGANLSLSNWVFLQVKQHPELTEFLAEFGFQRLSDWALLNRVRVSQMEQLSEPDRALVEAFHEVYRRDRRLNPRSGRCPNPTADQLAEMTQRLNQQSIIIPAESPLLKALKNIATRLRQFDIWQSRESLEQFDIETGQYQTRRDLPTTTLETESSEESEILTTLQQQLNDALDESLRQGVCDRITQLKKSKRYGPFAEQYITGLRYYYRDSLSLKEIPPLLGMSSSDQARRILNPRDLMSGVRSRTLQRLMDQVLAIVQAKGLTTWPPSPTYLQQLSVQLEAFIDDEYFQAAATEMKAGSYRCLDSPYAQKLLHCLDTF